MKYSCAVVAKKRVEVYNIAAKSGDNRVMGCLNTQVGIVGIVGREEVGLNRRM